MRYIAWNKITGMFWNGASFNSKLVSAKYITDVELICLRYSYQNVEYSIQ